MKISIKAAILAIAMVVGTSVSSMATPIVDQQNTGPYYSNGVLTSSWTWGQTITSSVSGTLNGVKLFFSNIGNDPIAENVIARVKVNGAYVGSDTKYYDNVGDSALLFDFSSANIFLSAGQQWLLEVTGTNPAWIGALNLSGNNAYTGGALNGNGTDYGQFGYDMEFVEYINGNSGSQNTSPVPEPSTFLLLGAGLAGLGLWRRKTGK